MKKLMFVVALAVSAPATAAPSADEVHKICSDYANTAKMVMKGRQEGVPMQKMMETIGKLDTDPNTQLGRKMVVDAYEKPQFQTPTHKDRTIGEFENQAYLKCHKDLNR